MRSFASAKVQIKWKYKQTICKKRQFFVKTVKNKGGQVSNLPTNKSVNTIGVTS